MNNVQDYNLSRLQVGDVITMGSVGEHIVVMVNMSRARCVPLTDNAVTYKTVSGKEVQFEATARGLDISPNSTCPIVQRLGEGGMQAFFDKRKEDRRELRDERRKIKEGNEGKPKRKHGRLGGLLGHSVVGILRAMGKAGWDEAKATKALNKQDVPAKAGTIRGNLKRGKEGTRKAADVTKAQLETLLKKKVTE